MSPKRLANFILCLFVFAASVSTSASSYGEYNLSDIKGGINLNRNWKFYWNTTLSEITTGGQKTSVEAFVPGEWNDLGNPGQGYGVYITNLVVHGAKGKRFGVYIPSVSNNYNFYVDGKKVSSAGVFSTIPEDAQPEYEPKIVEFLAASDTIQLAFEISNFFYREGGINYNVRFGEEGQIENFNRRNIIIQSFSAGALFIMAIYFLFIYFIRKREKIPLYFGVLCMVASIRIVSTEMILWRQFEVPLTWEALIKVEILSIMLIPTFGALYLLALVEEFKYRWIMYIFNGVTAILGCFVVFGSPLTASLVVPPFRYFAGIQLVFLLWMMFRAVFQRKHALGQLAAMGYIIIFTAGFNDILYSANLVQTAFVLPIAIFVYVIVQAIVLAKKSALAFDEVELLTLKLGEVNRNQEHIIEQRTIELNKKTKQLEQYNSIKDKIFSIIGHDLRAPIATLSSVLTLAEQADDHTLTELRSYFKGIKRSVDNLNLTIENLLVWSQSQINGVKLNKQKINLNNEVDNVIALFGLIALQKEIVLMHQINSHYTVVADPAHLNLILRNVVSNSLKFTNRGGAIVITASKPEPNLVKICIKDNGIGIQAEKVAQVLNPTSHFTTYGTLNEKGTGLGLMLCKEYTEANGGRITIESASGVGTKVCISLPEGE
jgi:two-component system, sensor histidine kinase ChiS